MEPLPDPLLEKFSEFVENQLGLAFPPPRWRELSRGIHMAAHEFGVEDPEACAQWLMSGQPKREQLQTLASALAVGETYFFREKAAFTALRERILPNLIASRRETNRTLRIWSAGCCTGEEAYSIAILVKRLLPDLNDWRVTIIGTDVNPHFLKKAEDGVYGEWSFRDPPGWLKEGYFRPLEGRRFQIATAIREMVRFIPLNLAKDPFPSFQNGIHTMDVIFCRNVLMYFSPERAKLTVLRLREALVDDGWLVVSPSEASSTIFSSFACVQTDDLTLYQKADSPASAIEKALRDELTARLKDAATPSQIAAPALKKAPEKRPPGKAPSARFTEATNHFQQGRSAEALRLLPSDLEDPACSADEAILRARILANQGCLDDAAHWSQKALTLDKLNALGHYLHAIILQEGGITEEAAISLRRALYLDPDFIMAHFALGNLEWLRKRYKSAQRHFQNTLALAQHYKDGEALPHSDGMVAGNLKAMVQSTLSLTPS